MTWKLGFEYVGTVTDVPDGDGIQIYGHHGILRIRLRHIDAPEAGQPYGANARRLLKSLCYHKIVKFRIKKWDQYSRAIADVSLVDGPDLAEALTKNGLAWWYRRFSRTSRYGELEATARTNKRGLWKDRNPIAPWEFRKAQRLRKKR